MTDELKFHKWIHNAHSTFYCPEFYLVDFSHRSDDLQFKLVTKILVAMATKMVATWRVVSPCFYKEIMFSISFRKHHSEKKQNSLFM